MKFFFRSFRYNVNHIICLVGVQLFRVHFNMIRLLVMLYAHGLLVANLAEDLQGLLGVHLGLVNLQIERGVRPIIAHVADKVLDLHVYLLHVSFHLVRVLKHLSTHITGESALGLKAVAALQVIVEILDGSITYRTLFRRVLVPSLVVLQILFRVRDEATLITFEVSFRIGVGVGDMISQAVLLYSDIYKR